MPAGPLTPAIMSVRSCMLNSFRRGFGHSWASAAPPPGPASCLAGVAISSAAVSVRWQILHLTAAVAREQSGTRVRSRRKLHCNGPVLRRKEGRESDSPVHRSLGSLLCPSSRVNDRRVPLRKFRVKLRLKLLPAVFTLGSAVPKLSISHNISHLYELGNGKEPGGVGLRQFGGTSASQRAAPPA
jgi:hypothetical protein